MAKAQRPPRKPKIPEFTDETRKLQHTDFKKGERVKFKKEHGMRIEDIEETDELIVAEIPDAAALKGQQVLKLIVIRKGVRHYLTEGRKLKKLPEDGNIPVGNLSLAGWLFERA